MAALAAACAWALPRAVLPHPAAAPSRLVSLAHAEPPPPEPARAAAPMPTVVTIHAPGAADDDDDDVAPAPDDDAPAPGPAVRVRGARERGATTLMGGAITRRGGVWVADLRALPPVRTVLAGTQLQLPNEGTHGEGYRVVRTDRNGLLAAAGVRPGDVLVGVDGLPLRNPDDVIDAVARLRRATRATFVFRRGGGTFRVPVEVVGRSPGAGLME